ncbi:keratin, type I cytoskeletal 18-like isoform X2 [Protopterus annectens]|uniref:keratin, type I cytoskeletal 18-like isoform X2 n=1 Tax=Protopterus annectens TaxID=7888 RepID=UPI001CF9E7FF|nr:keratin, type I cytoskeletal 18-like isoform X2 [Protopterus annectens]
MFSTYPVQNIKSNRRPVFSSRSFHGNLVSRSQQPISTSSFPMLSSAVHGATAGLAGFSNDVLATNEKLTMQNLNDRLASYLEKVHALEEANHKLERQIQGLLIQRTPVTVDFDTKYSEAAAFKEQIEKLTNENTKLLLDIDNAKLTAEDYRLKWETEVYIRQTAERDTFNLKKIKSDHENYSITLKIQLEDLQNELAALQSSHAEELSSIRDDVTREKVNVEVDSVPGEDLTKAINEVRMKYEAYAMKKKEEIDTWHTSQLKGLSEEVQKNTEAVHSAKEEITEKRRTVQSLETKLESLRNQVKALSGNLEQTNHTYADTIGDLQRSIISVEEQLKEIHDSMKQQKHEYEQLLKIKENLEAEIIVYRRLLEGEDQFMKLSALEETNKTVQHSSAQMKSELGSTASLQASTQGKSADGSSGTHNSSSVQMTSTSTSTSIQQASSAQNTSASDSTATKTTTTQKSTMTQQKSENDSTANRDALNVRDKSVDGSSTTIKSSSTQDKSADGSSTIIKSSSTQEESAIGSSTAIKASLNKDKSADASTTIKSSLAQEESAIGSSTAIKSSLNKDKSANASTTTVKSSLTQDKSGDTSSTTVKSSLTQGELINGSTKTTVIKATTQQLLSAQEKSVSGSAEIQELSATQETTGHISDEESSTKVAESDIRIRKTVQIITQTMLDGKLINETTEVQSVEEIKQPLSC